MVREFPCDVKEFFENPFLNYVVSTLNLDIEELSIILIKNLKGGIEIGQIKIQNILVKKFDKTKQSFAAQYEEQKRKNEARKKQKTIEVKEIKFRPNIDDHDYGVKMRSMVKFLEEGDKVKVTLRFRGRELRHQELGTAVLERVKTDTDELAKVEQFPSMEGRQMVMVLAPR